MWHKDTICKGCNEAVAPFCKGCGHSLIFGRNGERISSLPALKAGTNSGFRCIPAMERAEPR